MNKKLLNLWGLKWDPFSPELPAEALWVTPRMETFFWRVEQTQLREGGYALISGPCGTGKSAALRLLFERLSRLPDVLAGVVERPSSNVCDFYRELGELFGVPLRPNNRWTSFKSLRERWQGFIENSRLRPVLLVDEAQEVNPAVLNELRLLCSARFDSQSLLSVVLCGDSRLTEKFTREDLLPLGSRIRVRLPLEPMGREELVNCLRHLMATAGNARLMTDELVATLCERSLGNLRVMTGMASQLLAEAAQRELAQLDEKLYFELFSPERALSPPASRPLSATRKGARCSA